MEYKQEDYLQLSGIQHYLFCRRQWALIHLEQQWNENYLTADGRAMHKNAHDSEKRTLRGDLLTVRAMRIHSPTLGVSGECDVVEFRKTPEGVPLSLAEGLWQPYPVEYKRGKEKIDSSDEAQLCAQAMCLEEMLSCTIPVGAMYYGQPHRRHEVSFTPELRHLVQSTFLEMHQLYRRGYTPKSKPHRGCYFCSLKDLCLPKILQHSSAQQYIRGAVNSL